MTAPAFSTDEASDRQISGFDHLVYLRVFEGCNLHCLHCFIPANPRRMKMDDIRAVPRLLQGRVEPGAVVLLQWHGGEPTLMGSEFIREGIREIKKHGVDYIWKFGIQTNLVNFDKSWIPLYQEEFSGEVGVSWDPEIRLLNRHALESSSEYNRLFDDRLSILVESGLKPHVVTTATKTLFKYFRNPFDFFHHWIVRGVASVHLERVTRTGHARENWNVVGLCNAEYSRHMSRWMRAYYLLRSRRKELNNLHVSPFDDLAASVKSLANGKPKANGCWSGNCDMRFHTIDADGYKPGCTAITSEIDNRNAHHQLDLGEDIRSFRDSRIFDCRNCKYRPICSSGCLALDFDDGSGECSGGYGLLETASELEREFDFETGARQMRGARRKMSLKPDYAPP